MNIIGTPSIRTSVAAGFNISRDDRDSLRYRNASNSREASNPRDVSNCSDAHASKKYGDASNGKGRTEVRPNIIKFT
jgi:hypothetical protein